MEFRNPLWPYALLHVRCACSPRTKGSQWWVELSWERHKTDGTRGTAWGEGHIFYPHLSDQRGNLSSPASLDYATGLGGHVRRCRDQHWPTLLLETLRYGQLPRRSVVWSLQMEGSLNRYPDLSTLSQKWCMRILALPAYSRRELVQSITHSQLWCPHV